MTKYTRDGSSAQRRQMRSSLIYSDWIETGTAALVAETFAPYLCDLPRPTAGASRPAALPHGSAAEEPGEPLAGLSRCPPAPSQGTETSPTAAPGQAAPGGVGVPAWG